MRTPHPRSATDAETAAISEAITGSPDSPEIHLCLIAIFHPDNRGGEPVAVVASTDGRRSWTLSRDGRSFWVIRSIGEATLAPEGG